MSPSPTGKSGKDSMANDKTHTPWPPIRKGKKVPIEALYPGSPCGGVLGSFIIRLAHWSRLASLFFCVWLCVAWIG